MDLKGEYSIPASREQVWSMIQDPDILKACIPGCEMLEKTSDNTYDAKVTTKVGPVKATFNGTVEMQDLKPPESFTLSGEGKGGVAGFAKGSADIKLAEDGDGTVLTYTADAQVGGKLAQLGSRLIGSTAKKISDQFFTAFVEKASAGEAPPAAAPEPDQETSEAPAPAADDAGAGDPSSDAPSADDAAPSKAEPAPSSDAASAAAAASSAGDDKAGHHHHTTGEILRHAEDVAEDAEQKLEEKAAGGFLGGPFVWGLLILAAIILYYMIAT